MGADQGSEQAHLPLPLHGWLFRAQAQRPSCSCHVGNIWGTTFCQKMLPGPSCLACLRQLNRVPSWLTRWAEAQHRVRSGHRLVPTVQKHCTLVGFQGLFNMGNQKSGKDDNIRRLPRDQEPDETDGVLFGDKLSHFPRGVAQMQKARLVPWPAAARGSGPLGHGCDSKSGRWVGVSCHTHSVPAKVTGT